MFIILEVLLFIATSTINLILYLLTRFHIINALIAGLIVYSWIYKMGLSFGVYLIIVGMIVLIVYLLQNRFKTARIMFGAMSCVLCASIAGVWKSYPSRGTQIFVITITFIITALLNILSAEEKKNQ